MKGRAASQESLQPDYVLRAKTLRGVLAQPQALAVAAVREALLRAVPDAVRPLQAAEKALLDGDPAAAQRALVQAERRARASNVALNEVELAQRSVVTGYRYAYSEPGKPGRRAFEVLALGETFEPAGFPVWVELLNASEEQVSGPMFIDPEHPAAVDELVPIRPDDHKRRYNAWMQAKTRRKAGLKVRPHKPRSFKTLSTELDQMVAALQELLSTAAEASPVVLRLLQAMGVLEKMEYLRQLADELHALVYPEK